MTAGEARVLVVDDSPTVRDLVGQVLEATGRVRVVGIASTAQEAVALAAAERPDVIVLDQMMPLGTGADAIAQLRTVSPVSRIVMLTSVREQAIRAGAASQPDEVVQKSAAPSAIAEAVLRAMDVN